jgi:hypothetical protein
MFTTIGIGFYRSIQNPRRLFAHTISALFFASQCFGQPVSITDFRIPTSYYQRLFGTLSGSWQQNTLRSGFAAQSSSSSDDTYVATNLNYLRSEFSEDRSLEINANLNSNFSWYDASNEDPAGLYRSSRSSRYVNFDLTPSVRYSIYFEPDTWFWFAEGQGHGGFSDNRNEFSQSNRGVDTSGRGYDRFRNYQFSAGIGVGFGKMRDGQSVFATLRILDKLEEDGALERPLTHDEILRLVDYLARQGEYASMQDRYSKYLVRDIFNELVNMKILRNPGANAYEVIRASEVLSENIEPRLFGWRLAASVLHGASESDQEGDQYSSVVKNSREYLKAQADCGYPVSLNAQLSANLAITIPREDPQRRIDLTLGARASYQIGERIDASIGYALYRVSTARATDDSENFERDLTHQVDLRFNFFIENNVSFNVTGGYRYNKQESYVPVGPPSSNVNSSCFASMGLRYRFF